MTDLIIALILLVIIGAATAYIVKAKKSGAKCIGCPAGGNCSGRNNGQCGCHTDTKEKGMTDGTKFSEKGE
ncbi:MAG: FeoB-associated Cys-rich membrane protein [Lachnospiraceae bacterium]|nr:FeoB-associated Cys-rich membrane protein [Lachnospiraceae bacterium]